MPNIPFFQVDAFTDTAFRGNPAAVCLLDAWPDDAVLQQVAAENNLSETAFVANQNGGHELRWFTPAVEVDLCGHATLAAASVVFETHPPADDTLRFTTRQAGVLTVTREADRPDARLWMDFPARPAAPCPAPDTLEAALGCAVRATHRARDLVAEVANESTLRALTPDLAALAQLDTFAVCVTAPADDPDTDFVSRFFAPAKGVPEDPVTGSAHCTLAPLWGARLGKTRLTARQVSARGGTVHCRLDGDRIHLGGHAVRVIEGTMRIA